MENAKEKIEWTEETVRPYIFKMVEVSDGSGNWSKIKLITFRKNYIAKFIDEEDFCYRYMRPIIEKKTIVEPWAFETCPWPLSAVRKSGLEKITFGILDKDGAHVGGCVFTYDFLADKFTQLDGSPCGIVKEVDA
jgi:hypothetical protein